MKVVDPVMGDHGKLYRAFTPPMVEGIGRPAGSPKGNICQNWKGRGWLPPAGAVSSSGYTPLSSSIPTAVLSTHTGGFGDVCQRDLTGYMEPCLDHYRRIKMSPVPG